MARKIPPLDLMFLLTKTANSPKHVGALLTFTRPRGGRQAIREIVAACRAAKPVAPFTFVPDLAVVATPRWKAARSIDMEHHVQHVVLPPGTTREQLLKRVEDLHEGMLDRNRPLFRMWVIEGLPGGAFAIYLKIHHAIVDGMSAMQRITGSLVGAPTDRTVVPFYALELEARPPRPDKSFLDRVMSLQAGLRRQSGALAELYVGAVKKTIGRLLASDRSGSQPFGAPPSPMNQPIRTPRSFATLSLPIERMRAVGKAYGGTLNDVAVTVVDAGVHRYLREIGQPVRRPLVGMCPMSLRDTGDKEATTKASIMFVPLGAPAAPVTERMAEVIAALGAAKTEMRGMSKDQAMLYGISAFGLGELPDRAQVSSVTGALASFVLSNVAGVATPLYLRGARATGLYPVSGLGAGVGLNVTLTSLAGSMDFGFVANGLSMPDLPLLARHTGDAFADLDKAVARKTKRAGGTRTRREAAGAGR